jgi:hypothetical protein
MAPKWNPLTNRWEGPPPHRRGKYKKKIDTAEYDSAKSAKTDEETDAKHAAFIAKIDADFKAWELRQRRLYGVVYSKDEKGELQISMSPEYDKLLTDSLANGDLVEVEDGFFEDINGVRHGWKNPSPHDFRVRAEDWYD